MMVRDPFREFTKPVENGAGYAQLHRAAAILFFVLKARPFTSDNSGPLVPALVAPALASLCPRALPDLRGSAHILLSHDFS